MMTLKDLEVSFGGVKALRGITIDVQPGEVLGIVGPNGSGKSTLLNAVSGLVQAKGSVHVNGDLLSFRNPVASRQLGIARTFQTPQPYGEMSCGENVLLGTKDRAFTGIWASLFMRPWMWRAEKTRWAKAAEALEACGVMGLVDAPADALSYGERRFVELARVFGMDARVVLLDEPAAGLNDAETATLRALIGQLRDRGLTVVVVEHKIDFINKTCDRIAVLDGGSLIATGSPSDVWQDPVVAQAYLGTN